MIETINLTKRFGSKIAVHNLNLQVKKGELFGFLGPNAAGKTTTIKLLTGLLKPTSGSATVNGYDVHEEYIKAKSMLGYVPDIPYLYEKLTGREFLKFVSEIYGMNGRRSDNKIQEYIEFFDLKEYADLLIEEYSHGMRQKITLISALIHEPEVLIIDEPMVGLDPKTAKLVKDVFRGNIKKGVTIFISTHTLSLAEELCDRIGIIDNGNLVASGTIDEIRKTSGIEGRLEEIFLKLT